jgi:hypothetical protein
MSDETGEIPGGEVVSYATDSTEPLTVEDAARELSEAREKALNPAESAKPEKAATAEEELPDEGNADPETDPGEIEEVEAVDPPVERPKSWSKDEDAEWQSLPRTMQQKIVARESERDKGTTRSQQEAAEARKAAEAERTRAEQARQQYEAQLPNLLRELESVTQAQFGDIRTMDDVVKLQEEDPFRFQAWQVHQMRLQTAKQQDDLAKEQKAQEKQGKRANYEAEQNKLLVELVPEMADPKKASELRERAVAMLTDDLGLKNEQLQRWMADDTGHEILSNAGIQKLIADGLKYRDIQKAPKAVASKPVPPVQRPGVRPAANSGVTTQIQALEKQLSSASGDKAARISAEIWRLERKTASR